MSGQTEYQNIVGINITHDPDYTPGNENYTIDTTGFVNEKIATAVSEAIFDNTYNFAVDSVLDSVPTGSQVADSPEIIFVHITPQSGDPYYELLIKNDAGTAYERHDVQESSCVLDKSLQDLYILYNKTEPSGTETVPGPYQTWYKNDQFDESKLINLTHDMAATNHITLNTSGFIKTNINSNTYPSSNNTEYVPNIGYTETNYLNKVTTSAQTVAGAVTMNDNLTLSKATAAITMNGSTSSTVSMSSATSSVSMSGTTNNISMTGTTSGVSMTGTTSIITVADAASNPSKSVSITNGGSSDPASVTVDGTDAYVKTPILKLPIANPSS